MSELIMLDNNISIKSNRAAMEIYLNGKYFWIVANDNEGGLDLKLAKILYWYNKWQATHIDFFVKTHGLKGNTKFTMSIENLCDRKNWFVSQEHSFEKYFTMPQIADIVHRGKIKYATIY